MKQEHQCPQCALPIVGDMPEGDPYGTNKFFKLVHCDQCSDLKAKLLKTNGYISNLTIQLRSAKDPQTIDGITGSLKAHYTGKDRIQKKLDDRLPQTRQTNEENKLAKPPQGQLPW